MQHEARLTTAVVICSYSTDRWDDLRAAVESVHTQRCPPDQTIVVIDHNDDLLARARAALHDCTVVPSRHDRGLSGARNTGIEECKADLIAFLDDDAQAEGDWLERLIEPFGNEDVIAVGGAAIPRWERARPAWLPPAFYWVVGCSYEGLPTAPARVRNVLGCNMAFRTTPLREVGGFDSRLGRTGQSASGVEETEACIRLQRRTPESEVRYVPAARVRHFVPAERTRLRYFVRRCVAEGRSKAVLTHLVGADDALSSERRYTTRVLPWSAASALVRAARERRPSLTLQVPAIVCGLVMTAAGYAWARMTNTRSVARDPSSRNHPPRVAMVSARFLPLMGGTEMHVAELAPRLAAAGYAVEILTTDPSHELPGHDAHGAVPVRRFPAWPARRDLYFAPEIARRILHHRYDLVHVQGVHTLVAPIVMIAAVLARAPFLVTFHTGGHPSRLRTRLRTIQWLALRPLLRRAAGLVAVSAFERRLFARALGLPEEQISLIPNGVDTPESHVTGHEDPDLIVSVGRLEWYKGHHRAIEAIPHMVAHRPGVRLMIAGAGPAEQRLLELARRLDVVDRVSIRHFSPDERSEMRAVVGSAAVVVLLSEYEAHPLAVTEALTLNRRVVVADSSGLSEIAEHGLARAVPLDAPATEVATALLSAMSAPPEATLPRMASWDEGARAVGVLYDAVLGPRRPVTSGHGDRPAP